MIKGVESPSPTTPVTMVPSGETTTSTSIVAFDEAFSKAENISTVTCCFRETKEVVNVTCGNGTSCAAECTAQEAELCPSGNCTENPRDWVVHITGSGAGGGGGGVSPSAQSSSALKWCHPRCQVTANPVCCYNPLCLEKRPSGCAFFNFLTGKFQRSFSISQSESKSEYLRQVNRVRRQELFPTAVGLARCKKRPFGVPPSWMEKPKHIKV